jgi:hypothetical protein
MRGNDSYRVERLEWAGNGLPAALRMWIEGRGIGCH